MTDFKPFNFEMVEGNISKAHISEIETKSTQYEQLLADVWVGIVLTLLLLSCVCCMCSCLLYHKFQQWKRSVLRNNEEPDIGSSSNLDCESLPSYTIASGLPTYEEAVQQMKADRKSNKKPGTLSKENSNTSLQPEIPQSASKTSEEVTLMGAIQGLSSSDSTSSSVLQFQRLKQHLYFFVKK